MFNTQVATAAILVIGIAFSLPLLGSDHWLCQALLGVLTLVIVSLMMLLRKLFGRKPVYLLDLHCFQPPERYCICPAGKYAATTFSASRIYPCHAKHVRCSCNLVMPFIVALEVLPWPCPLLSCSHCSSGSSSSHSGG